MTRRDVAITALICAALFLLNVALDWPLFLPGESRYRDSIAGGYQGMARFFAAHPNPWGWMPLQYGGLPSQFVYVPGLPYASGLLSLLTGTDPAYAFKLLTAAMTCLGPATLFLFVFYFTRSRGWALAAALAYTFYSPLYGLIPQIDRDRGITYLPWHVHVLTKYGEGPHNTGLTLLPLALIAIWRAALAYSFRRLVAAAVLLVAIALTNWIAALATAICVLLMLVSSAGSGERGPRFWLVVATGALAYGLACFWLTPTFIKTIAFNWPLDAFNYQLAVKQKWLLGGWVAGILLIRLFTWSLRWPFFASFATVGCFAFAWPVLIFYSWGIDVLPESRRYALEMEVFVCLAAIAFLRFGLTSERPLRKVCALAVLIPLLIAGVPQARTYITQGYSSWTPVATQQTSEYKIAKWLADQHPRGRILATGGLRFRLNKYFDLEQVGGAFESGLKIRNAVDFAYAIRTLRDARPGREVADALAQVQALGVEYIVIHGPSSTEHYRDYKNPRMFDGVLERVYADGDDWIFRVPFRSYAHAVRPGEQPAYSHRDWIGAYTDAIVDTSRPPLPFRWVSQGMAEIRGVIPEGHDVSVAVAAEPGWTATQDGAPVWLENNKLGFLVVKARPSTRESVIRLEFQGTGEQKFMASISAGVWIGTGVGLFRRRKTAATQSRGAAVGHIG
ncbi:MAG: 6-pyruvoyl-tetrahydropterin synthase-related protein [Bryobacteraceae bacterium]|nr:6-pyruvoyl-tetrahydropterin synthase-related protein [Bryobacteraceae bacterium]